MVSDTLCLDVHILGIYRFPPNIRCEVNFRTTPMALAKRISGDSMELIKERNSLKIVIYSLESSFETSL